jgi:hypothetical protein
LRKNTFPSQLNGKSWIISFLSSQEIGLAGARIGPIRLKLQKSKCVGVVLVPRQEFWTLSNLKTTLEEFIIILAAGA